MPALDHQHWMTKALDLADRAADSGEVPVGAVVVAADGELIGEGYNQVISAADPTAHAEVVALRDAARRMNNYRLPGATLYVTLEPCTMCVGALVQARVRRVVFGAYDQRAGALGSALDLADQPAFNHHFEVSGGVLADDCGALLADFFKARR